MVTRLLLPLVVPFLMLIPALERRSPFSPEDGKVQVLVLGTFHFDNPGLDAINPSVPDMGSDRRQKELDEIALAIAGFEPDKILLEMTAAVAPTINERYAAWRAGERELGPNEHEQLGMRIADLSGLDGLHGIDSHLGMDMERAMLHAVEHGQVEIVEQIEAELETMRTHVEGMHGPERSLAAILRDHNTSAIRPDVELYMTLAEIGSDEEPVGADVVAAWFQRNLRIFGNLLRSLEEGDERVLIIYGSGHRDHLTSFVRQHPRLELVETLDYLPQE